ncbi:MAG: tetratricopeptide repeat protein [Cyanothece sp. SIO2G6]|nr:tetratricopeptide repeat protein [Cyanothece sp. SIO2G6]
MPSNDLSTLQAQAYDCLRQGGYTEAIYLYEQAIEAEPSVLSLYWHLGLAFLLQGNEQDAQATWLLVMSDGDEQQVEQWVLDLTSILDQEAGHQEESQHQHSAWLIRQHIKEIDPSNTPNLLHLIRLSLEFDYDIEEIVTLLIEYLQGEEGEGNSKPSIPDAQLVASVLKDVLDAVPLHPLTLELTQRLVGEIQEPSMVFEFLLPAALRVAYVMRQPKAAIAYLLLCLDLETDKTEVLRHLAPIYQNARNFQKGIEAARQCLEQSTQTADKVFANHLLLRGLTTAGGYWDEAHKVYNHHYQLLHQLHEEHPIGLEPARIERLFNSNYGLPYMEDDPRRFRSTQNQIAQLCQENLLHHVNTQLAESSDKARLEDQEENRTSVLDSNVGKAQTIVVQQKQRKKIVLGYISHCMQSHSVGWLARWLIKNHDRDRFQLNGYFLHYRHGIDPLGEWYLNQFDNCFTDIGSTVEVAKKIHDDGVDILIDLDSITLDTTCEVMALKPAPVQVTWLGWDASGIPAIDYFVADPYVLPDNAQDYYREKIWRLPETYIAVSGFEVEVPTLRRAHLGIPTDSIIYFSAQRGFKRHPETVKLQLKILKEVPNSYFLIKGDSDKEVLRSFFHKLAREEGVNPNRLLFLDPVSSEAIHRANLGIADVVLDTFPYNGATTTMETLWMGIPLVTKVGQQFAARNSYTMMVNAGLEEGIAWSDEEYIEWGVRLGTNETLRQKIHWKLLKSRQMAPLWDAQKFTHEMEKAYKEMWTIYLNQSHSA